MQDTKEFKLLFSSPKKIVLTIHINPDADALGSALGFALVLRKKGHSVSIISPNTFPDFLKWMKGNENILIFNQNTEACKKVIKESDLLFSLDYSALKRVGEMGHEILKSSAIKIIIDHHREPENYASIMKWDTNAGATCELIFDLLKELGWLSLLDKEVGECLYAGIMTDTGGFRYPNTTQHIHEITAQLLSIGVNGSKISKYIYDTNTINRIKLLGFSLSQRLKIIPSYNVAYIYLSSDDLKKYNAQKGDTEGLVNYALSIKGIVMAALFKESEGMIKISFRSTGNFSVNDFARHNFEGGGHTNAAGGISKTSTLSEVIKKFENLLPTYKTKLKTKLL